MKFLPLLRSAHQASGAQGIYHPSHVARHRLS
jgi:hypothetical protein